jgi:hypothetical protein
MSAGVVSDGAQQQHELIVTASKVALTAGCFEGLSNTLQASPYIHVLLQYCTQICKATIVKRTEHHKRSRQVYDRCMTGV